MDEVGQVEVMLGVSVADAEARIALLDASPPHEVIDQSHVALDPDSLDTLIATLVSTDRMLSESGHAVVATRVCDTDGERATALVDALRDADLVDVIAVVPPDAITAAIRSSAAGETVASLTSTGATAALSIFDSDTATTSLIAEEPISGDDHTDAYRSLLERLSEEPGGATSVIVVGAPAAPQWADELGHTSTVPLRFLDEPEFALARGAALAGLLKVESAPAPRSGGAADTAATMLGPQVQQLAYSEVADTGEFESEYNYAAGAVPMQTPMRALSINDPEEVEDDAVVAGPRPKMLLVGSTVAAVVVVGFAALAVSVAIGIRPAASQQAIRMQQETVPGKYFPVAPGQGVAPDGPNWTAVENVPPPGVDTGGVRTFETRALNSSARGVDAVPPTVIQVYRDGTVGVPGPEPIPAAVADPINPGVIPAIPEFVPRLIPDFSQVNMNQVLTVLGNLQQRSASTVQAGEQRGVVPLEDMVASNNGLGLNDLGKVATVERTRGSLFPTHRKGSAAPVAEAAAPDVEAIPKGIFEAGKSTGEVTQLLPPDATVIDALPTPPEATGKRVGTPIFGSVIPDPSKVAIPGGVIPGTAKPGSDVPVDGGIPAVVPVPEIPQQLPGSLPEVLPDPPIVTAPVDTPKVKLPDLPVVTPPVVTPKVELPDPPVVTPKVQLPDPPVVTPKIEIPAPPVVTPEVTAPEPPIRRPKPVIKLPIPTFQPPAAPAAPVAPAAPEVPAAPAAPVVPRFPKFPMFPKPPSQQAPVEAPAAPVVPQLPQLPLFPKGPFGGGGNGGGLFGGGGGGLFGGG